jgi:hypothetical protein
MQPTYLPWSGYFNLISNVDRFVFLDDVQFEKRSWQIRNRILIQGQECVLSIPVRKTSRDTPIREIFISNESDWRRKHWLTLRSAYLGARFGDEALTLLEPFFTGTPPELLADFNQEIIRRIAEALSLSAEFSHASDLQCGGARSGHLIQICRKLECDHYLSPRGSAAYLEEDNFVELSGLQLTLQAFEPTAYPQFRSENFISHLSIVDVIANIGIEATKAYIS